MKRLTPHINANERGVIISKRFFSMIVITVCETDSGLMMKRFGDFGEVPAKLRLNAVFTGPGQTTEMAMPRGLSS